MSTVLSRTPGADHLNERSTKLLEEVRQISSQGATFNRRIFSERELIRGELNEGVVLSHHSPGLGLRMEPKPSLGKGVFGQLVGW